MKKSLLYPKAIAISLLIATLFFMNNANAQTTRNWTNAAGGLWTTAGNWDTGVPVAGDSVNISVAPAAAITAMPTISLVALTVNATCNLVGSASGNTLTITRTFTVASGVTFTTGTNGASRLNMTLSGGTGSILGTLVFNSTITNALFSSSADLTMGSAGSIGNGSNASDFTSTASGILRIQSTAGISTTAGVGNIRVTGARTYTGSEVVYQASAAQVTGNGTPNDCDITITNTSGVALSGTLTSTGALTVSAGSTLDMINTNLTVAGLAGGGNLTHLTGATGATRTLSVTNGISPAIYSGVISNGTATTVALTKSGAGTLTLSGANTYNGITTISAGTLSINTLLNVGGGASALGAPTTVANGTIAMGATGVLQYTGAATSSNRVINTTTDGPTVDASGTGTLTLTGGITATGNNNFVITGTGDAIETGIIGGGTGTFTKNGAGTWTLSGLNTFSGTTTISAGVLSVGTIAAGGTSSNLGAAAAITLTGGTLRYTGATASTNRTVALTGNANVIDVTTLATNLTITGIASGALGGYTKAGVGTLTMGGVNTYTGVTTIGGGVLSVGTIGNGGVAGNLGQAAVAAANLVIDTGTLRFTGAGAAATNRGFTLTGTLAPFTTVDISTVGANLTVSGTVTGTCTRFIKAGAGTLTRSTTTSTFAGDLVIAAGTFSTNQPASVAGDWINNGGTFTGTGATVTFNGTSAQTIGGTAATTFAGLTINNAAGVSLTTVDATVSAALTLTTGSLTIPFSRTLTITSGTAIGGSPFSLAKSIVTQSDPSSTAKGFVRINNIIAATVYTIPSSDGTNYLPVTLTPVQATQANNSYSVCVFTGITANGERNGTAFTAGQKNTCVDAVWFVNYNGPGTPVVPGAGTAMTVGWPTTLEGPKFTTFPLATDIGIAHWDGPNWGIPSGTGTHGSATRPAVITFSPFGVGNPAYLVLATKITYFNAAKGNGYNTVNWQAACSSSQATFEVLRSTDGRNFTSINSLTASQARCAQPFDYQDNTAPQGIVYYRLKVIDIDGKESLSAIVKLNSEIKSMELTGIAPNPVSNVAQLKINASKADMVHLTIISTEGQVVYRNSVQLQPGSSVVNLDIAKLPAGVYMIKGMFSDGETNSVKFLKQ